MTPAVWSLAGELPVDKWRASPMRGRGSIGRGVAGGERDASIPPVSWLPNCSAATAGSATCRCPATESASRRSHHAARVGVPGQRIALRVQPASVPRSASPSPHCSSARPAPRRRSGPSGRGSGSWRPPSLSVWCRARGSRAGRTARRRSRWVAGVSRRARERRCCRAGCRGLSWSPPGEKGADAGRLFMTHVMSVWSHKDRATGVWCSARYRMRGRHGFRLRGRRLRRHETTTIVGDLVYLALAVFLAWGRFGPGSFTG